MGYSLEDMKHRADRQCDELGHTLRWHFPEHGESLSIQRATCKHCRATIQISTRGVTQGDALAPCRIKSQRLLELAYRRGLEAVKLRPNLRPSNPYERDESPQLYERWEEGAYDAGIEYAYNANGILIQSRDCQRSQPEAD